MKDTPIQKAIQQIESISMNNDTWFAVHSILQSLLPYERECIEGAYCADLCADLQNTAHDYFTQTFKQ